MDIKSYIRLNLACTPAVRARTGCHVRDRQFGPACRRNHFNRFRKSQHADKIRADGRRVDENH
ncbi:hypothetical protein PSAB6_250169 [Paraburkholderia sabiae]|nr:hypothetical protein PSAB6_250169 [Paraburkholderia sabiae]